MKCERRERENKGMRRARRIKCEARELPTLCNLKGTVVNDKAHCGPISRRLRMDYSPGTFGSNHTMWLFLLGKRGARIRLRRRRAWVVVDPLYVGGGGSWFRNNSSTYAGFGATETATFGTDRHVGSGVSPQPPPWLVCRSRHGDPPARNGGKRRQPDRCPPEPVSSSTSNAALSGCAGALARSMVGPSRAKCGLVAESQFSPPQDGSFIGSRRACMLVLGDVSRAKNPRADSALLVAAASS